ncbi:hypothetical protein LWI29_019094 [Acer saccharum]|uniref:Uncharacterized protein n=1 Tax=Acer saccharum TaxID=4024 RepID=A0AA39W5U8_ACESA|nr:hypothetical protein LWI29_019094 [Acer saccharum]
MVVVHGDYGRNLTGEAGSVMDPMFMEASLFVAFDPLEAIPVIDSLVQTVSHTVELSLQSPLIPYADHRVRKDCYGSSQVPS